MKIYIQMLIILFTCFTSSATFSAPKIVVPTNTSIFQKTETISHSEKAKISFENFARSSIEEQQTQTTTFHQNTFLLSSYLKEENSCVLDFQKAANSKSLVEGIQTGIDIVSLAIPGAQTCTALKMLNYLDKASSIASLSGSYLQDDYPDLANVLTITSSILAITDLSANGVDILLKANTNPSAAIDIISESEDVLDATAHIEHVEVLLDRITAPSPDPQVLAVLNSSNPKTKDFLVDILEAEKHSAKGADRMDIVNKIDEAIEVVSTAGDLLFGRNVINGINGFSDNIASVLSQRGLSLTEFKLLQQKRYDLMTVPEKAHIDAIRNSIPMPDGNTLLQKVIPKSDIAKYLNGQYKTVGGFVSTAKDAKHLSTFEEIYHGMRLDYQKLDGTYPFNLSDESCGVIRYKTSSPSLEVPKLTGTPDDAPLPFTGNGFTGGDNGQLGVPEWNSPYYTPIEGAELYEVLTDGTEILRARFSSTQNQFIAVP